MLISAEPGVGKSRLAEAFRLGLEAEPHTRFRYFGSPHLRSSTLTAGLSPTLNTAFGVSSATWWRAAQSALPRHGGTPS